MTYTELLNRGCEALSESGIRDARQDAYLLLNHVTGKDRNYLFAHGANEVPEEEEKRYRDGITKRKTGIPIQQITGETEFMGLTFLVDEHVLIPRIDTEFLTEELLKEVPDGAEVLDLCTGSGCILLSLMCYKNDIRGLGTDISDDALALAERNAARLAGTGRLMGQVRFQKSDLFEEIDGVFDHIVSNPPYIRTAEIEELETEVRDHEPRLALDGSADGLEFYRRIAKDAGRFLTTEGKLFLEIGYDQGEEVKEILAQEGYREIRVLRDYTGNERVVICSNR